MLTFRGKKGTGWYGGLKSNDMSMENGYCFYLYHVQVLEISAEVQSLVLEWMRHLIRGKVMEDTKNSFM